MWSFPLFPEQASTIAGRIDALYYFLVGLTIFFSLLIAALVTFFAIKYRRGNDVDRSNPVSEHATMEALWIGIPLVICLFIFVWSTMLFFDLEVPPKYAQDVYVVGKQWMWKFQHPNGTREINSLHVPVGRAVRLILTSQDVIHSMFIPAFRVKQDAVPGRYTQLWFQATKAGTYHLFCAEYCGTQHSGMIGTVTVMDPAEYEQWMAGGVPGETMVAAGQRLFEQNGCATCHAAGAASRAPQLEGLYGKTVELASGQTVKADDQYIRESILVSGNKVVAGYDPIMPVFQGRLSEDEVNQLVAYVKSLGGGSNASSGAAATPAAQTSDARGTTARFSSGTTK